MRKTRPKFKQLKAHIASLCVGLCFALLPARAEAVPSLTLAWIEETSEVPVSWRTSVAWVWQQSTFALQVWIEIPKNLAAELDVPKDLRTQIHLVNENTKHAFELAPDHTFLLVHLRSPSEIVGFNALGGTQRRALRVEVANPKTTWMRHTSCKETAPFLTEVSRSGDGPLFIALYCGQKSKVLREDIAVIQVQASDEAAITIEPIRSKLGSDEHTIVASARKAANDPAQVLAVVRARDLQGKALATYELKQLAGTTPEQEAGEEPVPANILKKSFGVAVSYFSAEKLEQRQGHSEEISGAFAATINTSVVGDKLEARTDLLLPLSQFRSNRTSLAWFRTLLQKGPAESKRTQFTGGIQVNNFRTGDSALENSLWLNPVFGIRLLSERKLGEWQALVLPIAIGAGRESLRRAQLHIRGEHEGYKKGNVTIKPFVEGVVITPLANPSTPLSSFGLSFGIQGEF